MLVKKAGGLSTEVSLEGESGFAKERIYVGIQPKIWAAGKKGRKSGGDKA